MPSSHLLRAVKTVLGMAALALILFVRPASAGSVNITTTSPTSLTVTEGGSAIIDDFTFTNNTGGALLNTLFQGGCAVPSGDTSDNACFSFLPSGTCNGLTSLGAGSSCTMSLSISSPSFILGGETETPTDSGVTSMRIGLTYLCPNCSGDTDPTVVIGSQSYFAPFFTFSVTANDAATPEPSSLLLLGTGLLGLGPFLRRRFESPSTDSE